MDAVELDVVGVRHRLGNMEGLGGVGGVILNHVRNSLEKLAHDGGIVGGAARGSHMGGRNVVAQGCLGCLSVRKDGYLGDCGDNAGLGGGGGLGGHWRGKGGHLPVDHGQGPDSDSAVDDHLRSRNGGGDAHKEGEDGQDHGVAMHFD